MVNTITWQAALDQADPAVAYKIYVSTDVETALATISATQSLSYTQHNIQSGVSITYYVSAVDVYGNESKAASITIP